MDKYKYLVQQIFLEKHQSNDYEIILYFNLYF
jgi:hypothetical protein